MAAWQCARTQKHRCSGQETGPSQKAVAPQGSPSYFCLCKPRMAMPPVITSDKLPPRSLLAAACPWLDAHNTNQIGSQLRSVAIRVHHHNLVTLQQISTQLTVVDPRLDSCIVIQLVLGLIGQHAVHTTAHVQLPGVLGNVGHSEDRAVWPVLRQQTSRLARVAQHNNTRGAHLERRVHSALCNHLLRRQWRRQCQPELFEHTPPRHGALRLQATS
mmetsp:Transcript_23427/g.40357  ORF Transcript_23427/g.40357 Transcript_23427/m.40357 type:complete len:216 (-) Transcript_23427:11-658(-)